MNYDKPNSQTSFSSVKAFDGNHPYLKSKFQNEGFPSCFA